MVHGEDNKRDGGREGMNAIVEKKYRCSNEECDWEGLEKEMGADYGVEGQWFNWICPKCECWYQLEDYEEIKT